MVFQSYALYPHMSVRNNIAFGAEDGEDAAEAIEQEGRGGARACST
jgi:ABC-type sugar transport system ATPase subunit